MPIGMAPAPEGLERLVAAYLRALPPGDGWAAFGDAEVYRAIPVHSAPLDGVAAAEGEAVPGLELTGWRLIARLPGEAALVDLRYMQDTLVVVAARRGGAAERLAEASAAVEEAADPDADWEASLLDLPEVGVDALVLRSPLGGLAVRLDQAEGGVVALSDVAAAAGRAARSRLAEGSGPDGT